MNNFWQTLKKPFTILAPMEDVTDVVFRDMVEMCGAPDVFMTEFTSADGMYSPGRARVTQRLKKNNASTIPLVAQIWGKTPEKYALAAAEIVKRGFDGVDINMGCPAKKIVKQGCCSALIDNPSKAQEIIAAVQEGVAGRIPVSVKTRLGFRTEKTEEWTRFLLDQNIDVLTMHGRIAKDMSKKPADWEKIGRVVEIRDEMKKNTLIVGNGDIISLDEVTSLSQQYKVDGVMIGRGVFHDPFIFNSEKSITDITPAEQLDLILKHTQHFTATWGETKNFHILRRFFKIYINGFDHAATLREALMNTETQEDVEHIVSEWKKKIA